MLNQETTKCPGFILPNTLSCCLPHSLNTSLGEASLGRRTWSRSVNSLWEVPWCQWVVCELLQLPEVWAYTPAVQQGSQCFVLQNRKATLSNRERVWQNPTWILSSMIPLKRDLRVPATEVASVGSIYCRKASLQPPAHKCSKVLVAQP